ncbi:MAG TPA: hypothetical protein DCQ76_01305 [Ruminococcaceae bacterium]|nr:hypothetical protein [Oscillospiraceae bacterium]
MAYSKVEDGVYKIKLDLNVKGDGGDSAGDTPQDKQDNENGQIAAGAGQTKSKNVSKGAWALNLAKQQGTKIASDLIGNIGDITGDYIAQANAQAIFSIAMTGVGIAAATAAGGVLGLAASVIGTGVSAALNGYNYVKQINMQNKNAKWIAQRVGYSAFL